MKKSILLLSLFMLCNIFAQEKLNAYKYVVIPSQYEFQNEPNQYGINMLLKYKFQQLGFETFLKPDNIPEHVLELPCKYLTVHLDHKQSVFTTKILLKLVNCNAEVVFVTQEGRSRAKTFKTSNNEALRQSLLSFQGFRLNYQPKTEVKVAENVAPVVEEQDQKLVASFLYNTVNVKFVKDNQLFYAEIVNVATSKVIGAISKSSKRGIYHVQLESKTGLGYYDETGSFIVEFVDANGQVALQKLQQLN